MHAVRGESAALLAVHDGYLRREGKEAFRVKKDNAVNDNIEENAGALVRRTDLIVPKTRGQFHVAELILWYDSMLVRNRELCGSDWPDDPAYSPMHFFKDSSEIAHFLQIQIPLLCRAQFYQTRSLHRHQRQPQLKPWQHLNVR